MLIKLLQECLDELKREFSKFSNLDHQKLSEEVLIIENALLKTFRAKLREFIGVSEFNFIGHKTKSLLRNIVDINSLLQTLINRCCVQFFV